MNQPAIPPVLPVKGKFSSSSTIDSTPFTASYQNMSSQPHHVFTGSGVSVKKTAPAPIYKWEENGNESKERVEIVVGEKRFVPSNINAIYTLADNENAESNDISDEYVDFQVVLTKQEMEALAARRKKLLKTATANINNLSSVNSAKHVHKNHAASMSLHLDTPYVDPKRIQRDNFIRR